MFRTREYTRWGNLCADNGTAVAIFNIFCVQKRNLVFPARPNCTIGKTVCPSKRVDMQMVILRCRSDYGHRLAIRGH